MPTYLTLLISYVYTVFYTIYFVPMLLGHRSSIYLHVHILIHPFRIVCIRSFGELLDFLLDITALSELEAQAFRYTRINIC